MQSFVCTLFFFCTLLFCLNSSIQHSYFEIHPCCCVYSEFPYFLKKLNKHYFFFFYFLEEL